MAYSFGTVGIIVVIAFEEIGEKKEFENEEEDKEFYQYQYPKILPHRHRPEAVAVEAEYPAEYIAGTGVIAGGQHMLSAPSESRTLRILSWVVRRVGTSGRRSSL